MRVRTAALATPFIESPSPPTVSCGGRRCRRRMRGALYEIWAIYRRWSERARRCANDVLVKRPLIRLRHLLPQLKSAGGEGLSIGGTAENERHAQLHVAPSFATNRCWQFHSAYEKCGLESPHLPLPSSRALLPPRFFAGGEGVAKPDEGGALRDMRDLPTLVRARSKVRE